MPETPWYAAGLRFTCTRCGKCCTGAPGHTWVDDDEIDAISERLGIDRATFLRTYTKRAWRGGVERVSLKEKEKQNWDCVFWVDGTGCTVYEDRPRQCRTWPFWRSNVDSPEAWSDAAKGCPGMGTGEMHPSAIITETAADDGLPD